MRAARVRAPGSSPSRLGPPKPASWASAGSPGLEWARRAPLMLMMRAPAVRIMRSRPRAEAASSNLLALHRAVQKHAPTPHGTRVAFRVRASDPGARITSISGTPATRRRRVGGNGGPPLKASPLRLCAATEGARCAARLKSLRRKPPTPQELEERTSGSPTCRRVRGGFSIPPLPAGRRRMSQAWTPEGMNQCCRSFFSGTPGNS